MTILPRIYTSKEILALSSAIEKDENSFKWLMGNNCIELAALCDVLVYGKDSAKEWLTRNGFVTLIQFIDALGEDDESLTSLAKSPHKEWAAVVSFVNDGDDNAMVWLLKSRLKHFAALATTLSSQVSSDSDGGFSGGGGSGGGSGGGGFGGGSFGGGGGGGHW
jgi:uncharacterized membrane protein YgcG